jgi:hypothetical protein
VGARNKAAAIYRRARTDAAALVVADVRAALPAGWRCVLAVGWGVTVFDAAGKTVNGALNPRPMPARLARAVKLAEDFGEWFWLENEDVRAA